MVIKYKFLDNTTSDVEVDDELGKHITEMDESDYNLNRKETRRHVYISELEENGHYIADDSDPLDDILKAERIKELMAAIEKLQPQQKELLIRVYWNKELQKNIAAEEGVSERAISGRMKRIINSLKKFLK
ncbi:MAG: sigma-70 family RNA polymerase sigma factor [Oscillospiraceae bacterium]|nr:sigma-70 family RNA polymerase sigma factor [Oscillospiraceae bacterium]